MSTQHSSITARIEALDSQYSQAQQIYKTTRSRAEKDKALKAMQEAVIIADRDGLELPTRKLYDRMLRLELTPADLKRLTDTQIAEYQKALIVHMDTPNEAKARQMNRMINDEKHRRSGYGN